MALHNMPTRIGLSIALFFSFCGWAIYLGGIAKTTNMCADEQYGIQKDFSDPKNVQLGAQVIMEYPMPAARVSDGDFKSSAYVCGVHFSLEWWIWAYQFFLIICGFVATWSEAMHSRHIILHLFSISTTLFTLSTSLFLKYGFRFVEDADLETGQGPNTAAAGGIVLIISNYVFAWVYGTEPEEEGGKAE